MNDVSGGPLAFEIWSLVIRHKFKLRITPEIWHMPVVLELRDGRSASIWDSKADIQADNHSLVLKYE